MKLEHLDKLIKLAGYAAREMNSMIEEYSDVLRGTPVGIEIDIDQIPVRSNIDMRAYWTKAVEQLETDKDDPEKAHLRAMPLYEDAKNEAEVDANLALLEGRCKIARELMAQQQAVNDDA